MLCEKLIKLSYSWENYCFMLTIDFFITTVLKRSIKFSKCTGNILMNIAIKYDTPFKIQRKTIFQKSKHIKLAFLGSRYVCSRKTFISLFQGNFGFWSIWSVRKSRISGMRDPKNIYIPSWLFYKTRKKFPQHWIVSRYLEKGFIQNAYK